MYKEVKVRALSRSGWRLLHRQKNGSWQNGINNYNVLVIEKCVYLKGQV